MYFLRGCKFSLERTKEKLDFFYSIKANCPEWFDNWDIDEDRVQGMVKQGLFIRLKGYDKEGRYVFMNRSGKLNPDTQSVADQFRSYLSKISTYNSHFLLTCSVSNFQRKSSNSKFGSLVFYGQCKLF